MPPVKVMTTDTTVAKIGRSMKKRASTAGASVSPFGLALPRRRRGRGGRLRARVSGHGLQHRLDLHLGADLQQLAHHHPRLLVEPLALDHAQAVVLELANGH